MISQDAFELYHRIREEDGSSQSSSLGPALPALGHAVSGSTGAAISNLLIYPLDLIITRLQVQKQYSNPRAASGDEDNEYAGLKDAIRKIYEREGGVSAFYSGVWQDTFKTVTDSFLLFLAYNFLRTSRQRARGGVGKALPMHEELGVGMIAAAFAKFFTTPVQNIVTRKQTAAMLASRSRSGTATPNVSPELSVRDIALQIRDEKGLQGFWSGYSATLVLTLNPALTFLFHETLLRTLLPREKRSDPGARLTFALAATSKAMASTITYPFSLAKARSQVSSQAPTSEAGPTSEVDTEKAPPDQFSKAARARQLTVFSTIARIARTEGVGSLYQGLEGEVLKGFFSHGLTMLVKERIHAVVIRLYYLVLRALRRYPSPKEVAGEVAEKAKEVLRGPAAAATAGSVLEEVREQANEVYDQSKDAAKELLWGIIDEDDEGGGGAE